MIDVNRLRRSPFAFPLAAFVALVMLLISETSYRSSRNSMDAVSDLSIARLRVQRVLRLMVDAEAAQRGYLLTGRTDYLEPYRNSIEALPETMAKLEAHYASRPGHAKALARLEELIAVKLSELVTTLEMYDSGRTEAWREILLSDIGKEQMEAIRAAAELMLVDEAQAGEGARKEVYDALSVSRIGIGVTTVLSLLALYLYLRQLHAVDQLRREQRDELQAERDQLDVEVKRRTAELTELSRHLVTAREDERSRLARELHDELGALLTTAKLDTARIKTRIGALSPEASERLIHLNETLNSGIALKRRIIEDLRPSSLSNLGLVAALEIQLREFAKASDLQVGSELAAVALRPEAELTVYRLIQEAFTNISKYAQAKRVQVSLQVRDGVAEVSVTDDGIGFDPSTQKASAHGLVGMRYRVEAGGGELTVHSAPGQGTRVSATLPLVEAA